MQSGKPLTIGFLTSSYPSGPDDPRGIFVDRLAHALADEGVNIQVVSPGRQDAPLSESRRGVAVRRFRYWPGKQPLTRELSGIMSMLKERPWLASHIPSLIVRMTWEARRLAESVDLIHAHWFYPAGLAGVAGTIGRDTPIVVTGHGGDLRLAERLPPMAWICTAVGRRSAACIGVSPDLCRTLTGWGVPRERVHFLPVPVPLKAAGKDKVSDDERDGSYEDFIGFQGLKVLFVGSLVAQKSPRTLLEAARILSSDRIQIGAALLGDGPQRAALIEFADSQHLSDVWMPGTVPPRYVGRWMDSADALVLPSINEGWGSVVAEALAVGTPAVVSESSGAALLVNSGQTGFLFPDGDARALADRLRQLAALSDDQKAAMGRACQEEVLSQGIDPPSIAKKQIAIYRDALRADRAHRSDPRDESAMIDPSFRRSL